VAPGGDEGSGIGELACANVVARGPEPYSCATPFFVSFRHISYHLWWGPHCICVNRNTQKQIENQSILPWARPRTMDIVEFCPFMVWVACDLLTVWHKQLRVWELAIARIWIVMGHPHFLPWLGFEESPVAGPTYSDSSTCHLLWWKEQMMNGPNLFFMGGDCNFRHPSWDLRAVMNIHVCRIRAVACIWVSPDAAKVEGPTSDLITHIWSLWWQIHIPWLC